MFQPIEMGARIYALRCARGISQKQLGDAVGLSHKAISTLESGARSTTLEKLVRLSEFFNVSADYLLGLANDPTRHYLDD
ncbi:helix-turn-helix domain-containing protein [Anaerotruncus massiliensis (ex Togo et al. 2019)]|uniref:helix-turn-helix domain-containing protein n=1 Tax=Anaerotruncus massiliensis (ex Togo et al. 2019) TaxID=1673720 RepID=UPI0027B92E3B|nr:helix-turn-helix transcriptional regulator [Anaerotruncus massiliensis (ex Togo et al. 2019)]